MGNPLPVNLSQECSKANKILTQMVDPVNGVDGVVPLSVLRKARGFAIFSVFRIGFLMSARAGSGLVIARLPEDRWSAPAALGIGGLGGGFNVGAEVTDFLIVLNTDAAVRSFMASGSLQLGGNLSVSAGPVGRSAEASGSINSSGKMAAMYSYSRSKGVYAGISVEGTVLVDREDANTKAYQRPKCTAKQILSGSIEPPAFASALIGTIEKFTMTGGRDDYMPRHRGSESRDSLSSLETDVRGMGLGPAYDFDSPAAREARAREIEENKTRNTGAYAFSGSGGGSARGSSSGGNKGRSTDYGKEQQPDWMNETGHNGIDRPKNARHGSSSSISSFMRNAASRSSPSNKRTTSYTSFTNSSPSGAYQARGSSRSFSTQFQKNASDDEDAAASPFAGGAEQAAHSGWGADSSAREQKERRLAAKEDREYNGAWALDRDDDKRRIGDMDALDRELQGGDTSRRPAAKRTGSGASGMQIGAEGWREDYGLPSPTRPGLADKRTSSAGKLWNRVRGNSSVSMGKTSSSGSMWKEEWPGAGGSAREEKNTNRPLADTHVAYPAPTDPRFSTDTRSSDEWETSRAAPVRPHSPPALMGDTFPPSAGYGTTSFAPAVARGVSSDGSMFGDHHSVEPSAAPAPVPSASAQVVASFDFQGQEEQDLSFRKGDVIDVLRSTGNREDWWLGRARGKIGSFPANYTEDI